VRPGEKVKLGEWPTTVKPICKSKKRYQRLLEEHVAELSSLQRLHYASNRFALLLIFQGMDAAGKDGANRVTTGIILAALIVGAALMMPINSSFQIFGYPGIAMICFLIATSGSGWLIFGILWKDYKDNRKRRE